MAALDITKAFDSVNHGLLFQKLNNYFDFNESACLLIQNYLSNRSQRLKCNNITSTDKLVSTGVPQGSVLGPLLFIIFINDITQIDNNCFLYADDCLIMTYGPDPITAASKLEGSLALYAKWYQDDQLIINAQKTNIMTISNKKCKVNSLPIIKFQSCSIKQCDKIKYLGIYMDSLLNMKSNLSRTKQKLYPLIQHFARSRKYITNYLAAIWYCSLIRPILEYGAPLLFTAHGYIKNELLKIENRCLKIISQQPKSVTSFKHSIPLLEHRLKYLHVIAFYKLTHSLVPTIDIELLPHRPLSVGTRLATSGGFLLGGGPVSLGTTYFNSLPPGVRALPNLKSFKKELKRHLLTCEIDETILNYVS